MPLAYNPVIVQAAQKTVDVHTRELGLEADATAEMQVFHLILSLLEFCDATGLDFDFIVERVREEEAVIRGETA